MRISSLFLLLGLALGTANAEDRVYADKPAQTMPTRNWDMQDLALSVKLHIAEGRIEGQATHSVRRLGGAPGWLRLNQVALKFLEIKVDGTPVTNFRIHDQYVDIPMPSEGLDHKVSLKWTAAPETGLHFRGNPGSADDYLEVWSQGEAEDNRQWFPGWDYPNDKFTLTTHITVPDAIHAVAPGKLLEQSKAPSKGWTIWSYRMDEPIVNYLVTIAAGDYQVVEEEGPVPFEYIGSSKLDPDALRNSLKMAKDQMLYFNELLGTDYPYSIYRQVLVQRFIYGAMENPSLTVLSDRFYLESDKSRWFGTDSVVAHELAHQWFGDLITCYGWRELWLNEGFATYYAAKWQEHSIGEDYGATRFEGLLEGALGTQGPMAARSWSKRGDSDNAGVYVRGASVLYMLREYLGEGVFNASIQRYVREHKDTLVESSDLRRAFEDESGEHLGWVFDQWVYGRGYPKLASKHSWADGALKVVISQTQESGNFSVPLTIEIGHANGVSSRTMWLEESTATLTMELDEPPKWVAVDPKGAAIASWDRSQSVTEWVAQLDGSEQYRAKIHAMKALKELKATDESVEVLGDILLKSPAHASFRSYAAEALGSLATTRATELLIQALTNSNEYIRESAASALGEGLGPDLVLKALINSSQKDESAYVRNTALSALAKMKPNQAASLARARLKRADKSRHGIEHSTMLSILGDTGRDSDLSLISNFLGLSKPSRVRWQASLAAVSRIEDMEERPKTNPAEAPLIKMLDDPNIRARSTAVHTLSKIGNKPAEAALRAFAARSTVMDPDLQSLALDAAAKIRIRLKSPEQKLPQDYVDLKRLEEKIKTLEERLERMEEWR
jgi:aminopeptidase N